MARGISPPLGVKVGAAAPLCGTCPASSTPLLGQNSACRTFGCGTRPPTSSGWCLFGGQSLGAGYRNMNTCLPIVGRATP
eukprot:10352423-Alexandrium_andersonii.AAC.1